MLKHVMLKHVMLKHVMLKCLTAMLLFVVCGTGPALLAQGVTTSALSGTVTDGSEYLRQMDEVLAGKMEMDAIKNRFISGARVTATHVPSGTVYNAIVRADGFYNLRGMRVGGPYTITVSAVNYKTETIKDIVLGLGENRRVDIALINEAVKLLEVTVTTKRGQVSSGFGVGGEIGTAQLERTPTIARSFQEMTRTNPLVVGSNLGAGDNVGGINIAGQNNRYNNVQVDGAVINDLFGLSNTGTPGGQAATQPVSLDAIEQMQVSVAPFDVRQSGFTGGLVNSVTRSGTNVFQGSAYAFFRNQSLAGLSPETEASRRTQLTNFSEYTVGARLGGPIVQDKLFFFANLETRQRTNPLELAINQTGAALNFPVSRDTIQRIIDIAKSRYNYNAGTFDNLSLANFDVKAFARIDWNISDEHRLTLRHNLVSAAQERGVDRTPTNLSLSGLKYNFTSLQNNTVLQLNSNFGSSANELRLSLMNINDKRGGAAGGVFPYVQVGVGPNQIVTMGTEPFSMANSLNQTVIEITNDYTMFLGAHSITIGTHNEIYSSANVFFPWYYGYYFFGSPTDFQNGTPYGYINRFSTDKQKYGETPTANFTSIQLGLYAADDWEVSPLLRVSLGLRGEMFLLPTKPYANAAAQRAFGYATDVVPNAAVLLSPRVGFEYDLSGGERQFKLRGGTGLFTGRAPLVWLSNQYSNTGVDIATNFIFGPSAPSRATAGNQFMNPNSPPAQQSGLQPGQFPATVNFIDPNFKLPQTWRSSLGADYKLPYGFVATLEGVFSQLINQPLYRNLKLGSAVPNRIDGRPIFTRDGGGTAGANFSDAFLLTNTSQGYQFNIIAQVQKQIGAGELGDAAWRNLGLNLAYTYGESWDVNSNPGFIADENYFVPSQNPQNLPLTRSLFDIPHKVVAMVSYRFEWGGEPQNPFATIVSLLFEGRSGRPFSYVYTGDPNGTAGLFGEAVNDDLFFVPRDRSQVSMTDAEWRALDAFISQDAVLSKYRGDYVPRNAGREPFVGQLDLAVLQDIPLGGTHRIQVGVNIFNVLNLLNPVWGWQEFVNRPSQGDFSSQLRYGLATFNGFESDGRMKLNFQTPQNNSVFQRDNFLSRWQMQLSVRYLF
jgi:hypothetical protein